MIIRSLRERDRDEFGAAFVREIDHHSCSINLVKFNWQKEGSVALSIILKVFSTLMRQR